MFKVLQENDGTIRSTSPTNGSTRLILGDEFCDKVIEFIKDAKNEIFICAYAWRWYYNDPGISIQKLNIELLHAQRRGVKINVIVDTYQMWCVFTSVGFKSRYVDKSKTMHSKAISIDNKTLVIGSHNYTKRATSDNYEASLAVQDYEVVAQFKEYFYRVWAVAHES